MKRNVFVLGVSVLSVLVSCKDDEETADCSGTAYECITFNGDKIPEIGDEIKIYADTTTLSGTVAGGKGASWNYGTLEKQDSTSLDFVDPSTSSNFSMFPTSNLAVNFGTEFVFLATKSNGVEVLGIEADVQGISMSMEFDNKYNLYDFPLNYGDEFSDDYLLEDTQYNLSFDFQGTNYSADSVVIYRAGTVSTKVDGCGKITTPKGEYDVLRVYKEEVVADTVIAHVFFGLGTIPVPIVQEEVTNRSYEFVTDSLNYPVATIQLDDNLEATEINYLD
jgi:hypothetical protein